jgi:uncharacterized protein YndB with AHSA1/START domain
MESINTTVDIAAAPAKIYEALTTTAGIKGWWTNDCQVGSQTGEEAAFRFNPMGSGGGMMEVRFRLDRLAPGEAVQWTCIGQQNNPDWQGTQVTFKLRGQGGRTTLDFAHTGFAAKTPTYQACIAGWNHFMASLKQYVETGTGTPAVR